MTTSLVYDGSFDGFLSCIFYKFEYRLDEVVIIQNGQTPALFGEVIQITTSAEKANRVWTGILKKTNPKWRAKLYKAFLSEQHDIESLLLYAIEISLGSDPKQIYDLSDPHLLRIDQLVKMVGREKHRMDAFIRFHRTKDNIYFAIIEPDFNVLPLNRKHFQSRYADQQWIIYDKKRKYGLYYDLKKVTKITMNWTFKEAEGILKDEFMVDSEFLYQDLWKNYFKSTNIEERINLKLHTQHVPKRYWKYLSEKDPN